MHILANKIGLNFKFVVLHNPFIMYCFQIVQIRAIMQTASVTECSWNVWGEQMYCVDTYQDTILT